MAKAGTQDDSVLPPVEKPKEEAAPEEGKQREERRVPYDEPEEAQVVGHEEVVSSPDGATAFLTVRMTEDEFKAAGFPERKRLKLHYKLTEVYSGQPRPYYSYDELEQIKRGELKK